MKNLKVLFACFCISLFLTSCLENAGNSETFSQTGAVVHYSSSYPGIPFLNTQYLGVVAARELEDKYQEGDCLMASFTVDLDNQPSKDYMSITKVSEKKIGKTNIVVLDSGSQDIDEAINSLSVDSITAIDIISDIIDDNLFLLLYQADADNQNYSYQLVYSDSLINNIPVLYICAEKSMTSSATLSGAYRYQAFDVAPFTYKHTDAEKNTVSFYLHYKKGVDKEGNNIYKSFTSNPIVLFNRKFPTE